MFTLANSADPEKTPFFLRRHIWVYVVCICSFFACIQPVPQVRTLNSRLATPLEHGDNILKDFENASPRLNTLLPKDLGCQRDKFHCILKSDKILVCPRKFMAVNLIKDIEMAAFIKQG